MTLALDLNHSSKLRKQPLVCFLLRPFLGEVILFDHISHLRRLTKLLDEDFGQKFWVWWRLLVVDGAGPVEQEIGHPFVTHPLYLTKVVESEDFLAFLANRVVTVDQPKNLTTLQGFIM